MRLHPSPLTIPPNIRRLLHDWHGGQGCPLYSLLSTDCFHFPLQAYLRPIGRLLDPRQRGSLPQDSAYWEELEEMRDWLEVNAPVQIEECRAEDDEEGGTRRYSAYYRGRLFVENDLAVLEQALREAGAQFCHLVRWGEETA